MDFEVVDIDPDVPQEDLTVWNETASSAAPAFLLAQAGQPPLPTPIGVFRAVDRPPYEDEVVRQIQKQMESQGEGNLDELLQGRNTWTVEPDGHVS
jgi:2-oxoglutarate ferredoxin oxidoreductase subunit beta